MEAHVRKRNEKGGRKGKEEEEEGERVEATNAKLGHVLFERIDHALTGTLTLVFTERMHRFLMCGCRYLRS